MNPQHHHLKIELSAVEGAMLRALGLMERRRYFLQTCQLHAERDGKRVLDIVVESERPAALLKRQLERLYDVLGVEIQPQPQSSNITELGRQQRA